MQCFFDASIIAGVLADREFANQDFDFKFETRQDAINAVFDYIQIFYNNERLHSYLEYSTPNDFEK